MTSTKQDDDIFTKLDASFDDIYNLEYGPMYCAPAGKNDESVMELDLPQISENKIFVRKANLKDFKKGILKCKPTVNECFLELYAKFL